MNNQLEQQSLDLSTLRQRYRSGLSPEALITQVYEKIAAYDDPAIWIYLAPLADSLERARALQSQDPASLPLYGVPFAIKDNIDWAESPTTAGCPAFAYRPTESATVVQQLCAAGAIPIGKTNLDQFATGLVGTRTPYGICRNPFDSGFIPGGSSAGSAAAVAAGLVSFALGTDTAGSGRVPAAFTNIVGLKPTKGYLSTSGLVPAVRSLDCISIFALTCTDAATVLQVAGGFDAEDAFSRAAVPSSLPDLAQLRVGIPAPEYLKFFGNTEAERNYQAALKRLRALGCELVTIDFRPFAETVPLLYQGAWVAERLAAVGDFLAQQPEPSGVDPTVRQIIESGRQYDAVAAHQGLYQLAELKRQSEAQWQQMDILALPTTGTIYTLAEVKAEPLALNTNLGTYTNFVNLLDLAAIALPSGFQSNGLPTGLSLIAPAWTDQALCELGDVYHRALGGHLGATSVPLPSAELPAATVHSTLQVTEPPLSRIKIAVVGAHLSGQPLNPQLTDEQGVLIRACRTSPIYKLYALVGGAIPKPGLVRQGDGQGHAIELEVWELPAAGFGRFVNNIPSPLGIGTIILEDGEAVKGFLCEPFALEAAPEISQFGGWRAYLASL